ncbi:MAG: polysaccharide biosynthesis tyrosine autokinase [Chlamydiota bacterium]|nr:polysaccharide biosynthesis tyrosine autokinase [Chlamydiota bacterium]
MMNILNSADITDQIGAEENIHLSEYLSVINKRKWLVFTILTMTLTITAIATFSATPIYRATCKVLIEKEKPKVLSFEEVYEVDTTHSDYYQTQYEILRSKTIAKTVFEQLNLQKIFPYRESKTPLKDFMETYSIEPIRNSRIVQIHVKHDTPKQAAIIANTLAKVFLETTLNRKLKAARYVVEWLSQQLNDMQDQAKKSELALQAYIEKYNLVSLPTSRSDTQETSLIDYIQKEKIRLETDYSQLSKRYKPKHPKMLRLQSQIDAVNQKLTSESKKFLELKNKQIQYNILKREAETNQELYNSLLSRAKETNLFEGLKISNISIVETADAPILPIWPNKRLNFILALLGALMGAISLVFFLEYLDNTIKDKEDIERFLKISTLGNIPKAQSLKKKFSEKDLDIACFLDQQSPFTESFRYIKAAVLLSHVDKPHPVLLITSSNPGEGKTTIAVNLAITMAATGENVLLIDADLRNPRVNKIFKTKPDHGLSSILAGLSSPENSIFQTQIPNLSVLSSGLIPPNPNELLASDKMKRFINWAGAHYQRVILDSPPVMAVSDPLNLVNQVDGTIFVIQAGKINRKIILQGLQRLKETNAKILGAVLNKINEKSKNQYYYYYSSYHAREENHKSPFTKSEPSLKA